MCHQKILVLDKDDRVLSGRFFDWEGRSVVNPEFLIYTQGGGSITTRFKDYEYWMPAPPAPKSESGEFKSFA